MTWKDFAAGVKAVFTWCYTEVGTLISFLKSPGKDKYSAKRIIALALVANGIWMLRLSKDWFQAGIALIQIAGGVVLMVVAALTKT
jgi:hypothetical protein